MSWSVELTPEAEKQLRRLPRNIQKQLERSIDAMKGDPFAGNVKALQGEEWKGVYRKRAGNYRIMFNADRGGGVATVLTIRAKSEKTYRLKSNSGKDMALGVISYNSGELLTSSP
jgi:mRNA-degrading endonuclease RelE of RelBE toxin-antitoxin system